MTTPTEAQLVNLIEDLRRDMREVREQLGLAVKPAEAVPLHPLWVEWEDLRRRILEELSPIARSSPLLVKFDALGQVLWISLHGGRAGEERT